MTTSSNKVQTRVIDRSEKEFIIKIVSQRLNDNVLYVLKANLEVLIYK